MRILWERMLWRLVAVQALPTENSRMEDVIVFRVEHLPGSEHGPMIDRDRLRRFGTVSAPAWRAYLRLAYLWDAVKAQEQRRSHLRDPPGGSTWPQRRSPGHRWQGSTRRAGSRGERLERPARCDPWCGWQAGE